MSGLTAVWGDGRLADLTCRELTSSGIAFVRVSDLTELAGSEGLLLVLSDGWNPHIHRQAEDVSRQSGIPWLRAFASFGEGIIGPMVRPGESSGCSQCADSRRLMAGNDRREMWQLRYSEAAGSLLPERDVWASANGLRQMAHLVVDITSSVVNAGPPSLSDNQVMLLHLKTLSCSKHFILPDPLCPVCGHVPDDSAELARIELRPSPKAGEGSYRSRPMDELRNHLAHDYLDFRTGCLNAGMQDLTSPFADASVNLPLFQGDEGAAGRTHSYTVSKLTAILEGLERYCGLGPRGKRTVIQDSYRHLEDRALHPASVGLHAPEQYERPNFPFRQFDPEQPVDWVWGWSLQREQPILIPEALAYYSTGCGRGFVYETSNGCALGGSLEEAIFYGILEVVERDSFLMTWYARLPLPRIDPYSSGDKELDLMCGRLRAVAGYEVLLFDATMEHGIPSVWSFAKNVTGKGLNLICAAGAHPDPVRAAKSSVHELAGMLLTQNRKFEHHRADYEKMLDDPYLVREMEDHSMLYGLPQAETRFDFLLKEDRPLRSFRELYERAPWNPDLTDDLKRLLDSFRRWNLDVIVVNQSTRETLRNGLHCVKVIIPGMLPMTFGYHLTRLTGLDRVLKVPVLLGYSDRPLAPEQLNPHPHPFP
ncbi:TOMM precursor leader peptide-binding protein [Cohnella pontilimi]|uniref:TOMM leader peptide-binding protein n=1 Tax=Cohnella pontilimi TaxID=2564100 RepID=A0A4U0FGB2_9BACL|nr:TOMM precursor leader peptide-binding protein [Cohnella pontilimi]TJY43941.1 TOMM precursor leader peptide-binding protein [Cohnella pontilimi]